MGVDGDGGEPGDRGDVAQMAPEGLLVDREIVMERQQAGRNDAFRQRNSQISASRAPVEIARTRGTRARGPFIMGRYCVRNNGIGTARSTPSPSSPWRWPRRRRCPARPQAADGAALFNANCAVCHSTEPGTNKLGPSLAGIVGRKSASLGDYCYSPAMAKAGITWDRATLDKYLTDPQAMVAGHQDALPRRQERRRPRRRSSIISRRSRTDERRASRG